MNVSDGLNASAATENYQHEAPDAGAENKKGSFGRYLVTLVKNVGKYIADGVKSLCQLCYLSGACCYGVLRSVISACSPSSRKKEEASSEFDSQESTRQASEEAPNKSEAVSGAVAGSDSSHPVSSESDSQESAPQASEGVPNSSEAVSEATLEADSSHPASSYDETLLKKPS